MKLLIPILLVLGLALLVAAWDAEDRRHDLQWKLFKQKHGRKYNSSAHESRRKQNFVRRAQHIENHNNNRTLHQHKLTLNHFADWDDEEISKLMSEHDPENQFPAPSNGNRSPFLLDRQTLPSSVDLRTSPCMAPVKYQGGCGSCYSFASITPVEYQSCLKRGNLTVLSEKNVIDCSSAYGNMGCNGGLALRAWNYMMVYGIDTNMSYPYVAEAGTCKYSNSSVAATVKTWYYATTTFNEEEIRQAVATYGPVSVSVDANYWVFYESGIFTDTRCSQTATNHGVSIVGYGTDSVSKLDYWIIRNSWGTLWGVNGYILMQRGINMCGIAKRAVYPIVA